MSKQRRITFIYFDVGGVLLEFKHTQTDIPKLYSLDTKKYSHFMESIAYDRSVGKLTGQDLDTMFLQTFGLALPASFWAHATPVESFKPITVMHDLARRLENKYRLGLLTNVSKEIHERINNDFADTLLPQVRLEIQIASWKEGVAKPNQEIYTRAIARAGVNAHEILFIDDMAENVEAAQKAGMNRFLFETDNPDTMVAELQKMLLD